MMRTWMKRTGTAGLAAVLLAGSAAAVTPLDRVTTSPDVTTAVRGRIVRPENVLHDDLAGTTELSAIPGIPSNANLQAYELLPSGQELFSLDISVHLPGSVTAGPRDVVFFDPATSLYSIAFRGSSHGIPDGARIDEIAVDGPRLLLSFDVAVSFPGFTADDDDAVAFDPGTSTFALAFDGGATGVLASLDLDGLARLSNGHLLVSFDTSGSVGGVSFDDEDMLEWSGPAPGTWEMAYDGSFVDANWRPADLDALSAGEPGSDLDGDGIPDVSDNCPRIANPAQDDTGGVGNAAPPDGIGDACQCGDVSGDGRVTLADSIVVQRSVLVPPAAVLARPDLCDVGGAPNPPSLGCTVADAVIIRRALLSPPTATLQQVCPAADGTP